MDIYESIMLTLIVAILVISYFSPEYNCSSEQFRLIPQVQQQEIMVESFGNYDTNNSISTSSYPNPNENIKQSNSNQNQMCNNVKLVNPTGNQNNPSLLNSDGSIINGYQPSIIRPLDRTDYVKDNCSWPTYSKSKHQQWCSEQNAIDYYAMRPLITPKTYNSLLNKMFKIIVGDNNKSYEKFIKQASGFAPEMFCSSHTGINIMKWLMERVAIAVDKMPEFQKNSSWKNEEFHYTDLQIYEFKNNRNEIVYKLLFNLYNPLRSTATMIETVILSPNNQGYIVIKMDFLNKGEWDSDMRDLPDGMQGYNIYNTKGTLVSDEMTDPMDWNYANTLNEQKFNKYGFWEKGQNIKIEGGVPESLKKAISIHENDMLFGSYDLQFTGIDEKSGKQIPNTGYAKLVDDISILNPTLKNTLQRQHSTQKVSQSVQYPPSQLIYH